MNPGLIFFIAEAGNRIKQFFFRYLILVLVLVFAFSFKDTWAQKGKIAVFGSSVANGSGDTTGAGGYAGLLKKKLESLGWQVVNVSKGGDNTTKIMPRFDSQLLPEKPNIVILGLSLGNEGIVSSDELTRNRNFEKYRNGLLRLIQLCRENNMYPVVVNCYTRNDFQPEQYEAVKKMNLIINTWDVPSVNVLGNIDNGKGNWLDGYWHDKSHPDYKGHQEIFYAFVPGLFDAIKAGKPVPYKLRSNNYAFIKQPAASSPFTYTPDDTVHCFSVSFMVKSKSNGTIAAIIGEKNSGIEIADGKIIYRPTYNEIISSDTTPENKGWQYVVLTHQYATGLTSFYVNGKLAGKVTEKIDLKEFVLGGNAGKLPTKAPSEAAYKDLLIYRSVLNPDEVKALYYDQLLQSSLELYAPLNDKEFKSNAPAHNYAQSTSKLTIDGDSIKSAGQ